MTSARQVWELSRALLADQEGSVAVLKTYLDESGIHDGSPVLTVAAYTAKPKTWREWTRRWNVLKRPVRIYHAADAAALQGEFKDWPKEKMNALAARLLPLIAEADLAGVVVGLDMVAFQEAINDHPRLRQLLGTPYTACFHWLVGMIIRTQNRMESTERIAFFHEINDYQGEALQSFTWIKNNVNLEGREITLGFGSKEDYVPLQAADILAFEGNKRLRNPAGPARRAWQALSPKTRIHVGAFNRSNMDDLIDFLSGMYEQLSKFGPQAASGPYWGWRKRA